MAPSVQRRKVWLTPTTRKSCSNAAKTRNPLKLGGVPQTTGPISAACGLKCTILWGRVEEILLLNKFFFDYRYVPYLRDIARQSCAMVARWRFLRPVFSASRVQQVSYLHLKFALRPHYVHGSMTDIQSATAEIRRGKKDRTRMWANAQRYGRPAEELKTKKERKKKGKLECPTLWSPCRT